MYVNSIMKNENVLRMFMLTSISSAKIYIYVSTVNRVCMIVQSDMRTMKRVL